MKSLLIPQARGKRFLAVALCFLTCGAMAQLGTGTLNGTLTDPSGAVVPGASLSIVNTETNETRSLKTDERGHYSVPGLAIGRYRLEASAPGFGTATREGIELSVGAQLTVDAALAIGVSNSVVNVEASAEAEVNSTSGEQSTLIDQKQIRDLPLNGRNFEQLILLAPGVQPSPASSQSSFFGRSASYSISGTRPMGQLILLDGANIQGYWDRGTGASIIGTSLGVEAIAEFQTLTGIYGAQFGGDGGVINAVTKSGTNQLHGSVYDFVRNSVFDARNYFDAPSGPPSFRRNQFGGSIGLPIRKNKTFFFTNYEGLRQQLGLTNVTYVPDQNAHNGYLPCALAGAAYTCGSNGLAYVGVKPAIVPFLSLLPLPNTALIAGSGSGTYSVVANKPANENYINARLDEVLSPNDTVSARYVSDNGDLVDPFPNPTIAGFPEVSVQRNRYATIENTRIFSRRLLDTTRFHFIRTDQRAKQEGDNPAFAPLLITPGQPYYGSFTISTLGTGAAFGGGISSPFSLIVNKFSTQNDTYITAKTHQLQFGIDVTRTQTNSVVAFYSSGQYLFPTLVFFLNAAPAVAVAGLPGSDSKRNGRELDLQPYIQDDWKVNSRLSLNLGVRYDFVSNPVETNGKYYAILNPGTSTGFTQVPHAFATNPSLKNVDTRFGFSYTPFGSRTALRGGFGIFHDDIAARNYQTFYNLSPPYSLRTIVNPSFPTLFAAGALGAPSISGALLYTNANTPYQMQSSLGIQQQLDHDTVLTVSYVGNEGRHLYVFRDQNPPLSQTCPCSDPSNPVAATLPSGTRYYPVLVHRTNPAFGTLNYAPTDGTSHYHSLQTSLVRRLSHGVQFQLNYTWSKAMDYSSISNNYEQQNGSGLVEDPNNVRGDYGPSSFDIRHVGTANIIYAFPVRKSNLLLSGWEATLLAQLRTGSPYNVLGGFDRENISNALDPERPNVVGNPNQPGPVAANPTCVAPSAVHTVAHYYNPCAFQLQPAGTVGNLRRNQLYSSGLKNFDFAMIKNTSFHHSSENFNVELRAEFFNLFNHTNLGFPNFTAITNSAGAINPAAGQIITTTTNSRQVQFGMKVLF